MAASPPHTTPRAAAVEILCLWATTRSSVDLLFHAAIERLADLDQQVADLSHRAINTRAGYVYVISNIGSFGERVIKIGTTRRPDPQNHIRELSAESVPFDFDIHALFFSTDATGVVEMLHEHFDDRRVNLVNERRDFFYATPLEVLDVLAEHRVGGVLEFRTRPGAVEYRTTLELAASAP
jgi:hypothetical protein